MGIFFTEVLNVVINFSTFFRRHSEGGKSLDTHPSPLEVSDFSVPHI